MTNPSTKYYTNIENVISTLDEFGIAIIPNLLDNLETDNMINGMWNTIEHLTSKYEIPISRNDESTWKQFYNLLPLHSMLIQHHSIGHAQFAWDVRQNPKVVNVFSKIWNTNQLLTSFDGISIHLPPEKTGRGFYRGNEWYHIDQKQGCLNKECIQGWVTAYDVNDGDATLAILEKSHLYYAEFFKDKNENIWKLTEDQINWFLSKGCVKRYITCPKGSLVLWDSRTLHCGKESEKTRKKENFRCVVYVCMMPKQLANEKIIEKRKKLFNEMRLIGHHPIHVKTFPKMPRTYGRELQNINPLFKPNLSDLGLSLVGFGNNSNNQTQIIIDKNVIIDKQKVLNPKTNRQIDINGKVFLKLIKEGYKYDKEKNILVIL